MTIIYTGIRIVLVEQYILFSLGMVIITLLGFLDVEHPLS